MNIFGGNNYPPPKRNIQTQMDYMAPPSIFSPSSSKAQMASNTGMSPLSYGPPPISNSFSNAGVGSTTSNTGIGVGSQNTNSMRKRIWIKRPNKTPTTLFVGPNDIIDDLKSQVMMKFPTSLAVQVDPSDLIIKLELPAGFVSPSGPVGLKQNFSNLSPNILTPSSSSTSANNTKNSIPIPQKGRSTTPMNMKDPLPSSSVPISPIPVSSFKSVLLSNSASEDTTNNKAIRSEIVSGLSPSTHQPDSNSYNGNMILVLEPDTLVWKVLDLYFPQGMKMTDAFIVESPYYAQQQQPLQIQSHHGRKSTHKNAMRGNSSSEFGPIDQTNNDLSPYYYNSYTPNVPQHTLQFDNNGFGYYNPMKTAVIGEQQLPSPRDYTKFRKYSQRTPDPSLNTSGTVLLLPKGQKSVSVSGISHSKTYTGGSNDKLNIHRIEENYNSETQQSQNLINSNETNKFSHDKQQQDLLQNQQTQQTQEQQEQIKKQSENNQATESKIPSSLPPSTLQKKTSTKDFSKTAVANILSNINVLVVEDNLVNQKIMSRYLKSCSVRYKIASTGKEAIEMWREGGFHLVFMDIQLPVMSGMEVTQEIRRLERLNRIGNFAETPNQIEDIRNLNDVLDLTLFRSPIIIVALTASTSQADKQNALAAGCNDYLTKPVQLKWLKSKLNEWGCMQALINYDHFKNSD